jgi:3-hydroxybutyrate dehydrogenase
MRLNDKVAIITGAASGIGKDIAIAFAREGAKVAIADLNQKPADATAREIDPGGKRAIGVAMDVTDEQQVEAGTAKVVEAFGALDILVSNAGIQIVAPIVDFGCCCRSSRRCLSHGAGSVAPDVQAAKREHHLRGLGALEGSLRAQGTLRYAKHGLVGLAKVVAKEGAAHGVRANVIFPGFVRTPLVEKQIPEQAKELGISEQEVIKNVMLKETVDGEFTRWMTWLRPRSSWPPLGRTR